mmetsp:Transcript_2128/g.5509  ORF Transcript_2128/g.5509 Transcript_2128/m.5509 type:complete len:253 (+) Transcript_2128:655-1413(+)
MKSSGTSASSWIHVVEASSPSRLRLPPFAAPRRRPPPSPSLSDSASQASRSACTASCAATADVGGSGRGAAPPAAAPGAPSPRLFLFACLLVPNDSGPLYSSSPLSKSSQLCFGLLFASPMSASSSCALSSSSSPSPAARAPFGRSLRCVCRCTYSSSGKCAFGNAAATSSSGSTFARRSTIFRTVILAVAVWRLSKSTSISGRNSASSSFGKTKTTTFVNLSAARHTWASSSRRSSSTACTSRLTSSVAML